MGTNIEMLQEWIDETGNIVFFSGAGLSVESGIPDFRRMEEEQLQKYEYPPEAILSRLFFERKPDPFFRFYRERILAPLVTAEPNAAHRKLAELEAANKLRMIITQNIDDLHQEAGNRKVMELYGSVMRNDCPRCERRLSTLELLEHPGVPYCDVDMCGGVIAPEVHLYGDAFPKDLLTEATYYVLTANLFIVAGTSMLEQPAASILYHYAGKKMVLINETPTPLDGRANLIIRAPVSEVLAQIKVNPHT